MQKTISILNKQVADWNLLFVKLHNYHWYVTGEGFFTLHERFEKLYNEAATNIDVIAERVLAIKGEPTATMKEYLAMSTIAEGTGKETPKEMVENINKDFSNMIVELKEAIDIVGEEDEPTADMLLGIVKKLEKHVWMLSAYLK